MGVNDPMTVSKKQDRDVRGAQLGNLRGYRDGLG